ncbi:MAG: YDG domain-containing protein [Pseudomonadota bacterium]
MKIADNAKVTTAAAMGLTGTWLIDPQDYTVAASGGDITGAALATNLGTTNVTLQSSSGSMAGSGNVNVNDAVAWSANNTLTLTASNNVNVNANITATGNTAGLVINPNTANGTEAASGTGIFNLGSGASVTLSGTSPSLTIAGTAYTVINSLGAAGSTTGTDLQGMNGNLSGYYALGSNIDASATSTWNSGAGFTPVGTRTTPYTGKFDGLGHTISNLTINQPATDFVGLFGYTNTAAAIQNVGQVGGSISGGWYVGGLVGSSYGKVSNSYATGSVSGSTYAGGLMGINWGTVSNSHAAANVTGGAFSYNIAGLLGGNYNTVSNSYATGSVSVGSYSQHPAGLVGANYNTISNSYATGNVTADIGSTSVGGLVGYNGGGGTLTNSYATGNVTGLGNTTYGCTWLAGLIGYNDERATVSNSYANGSVTGVNGNGMGGLTGYNGGTVSDSYATGNVTGTSMVGGLVGRNPVFGTINNSYSTGSVSATGWVGGLVGYGSSYRVTSSYWDTTTSGQSTSAAGTGLTTAQMQTQSNFSGWDFANTWVMYDTYTYPLLRSFMTPLTVTANNDSKVYDKLAYSGGNGVTYSVTPNANLLGTVSYGGSSQGAINAGSYVITPGDLYSNQQGYIISYSNGTATITPKALSVSGTTASNKIYNGTTAATLTGGTLSGVISGDTVTLTQAGIFTSKNVGTGIAVTGADTLGGASASNYSVIQPTGLTANITARAINLTGSRIYDGTTTTAASIFTLGNLVSGETLTLSGSGSVASKNVSAGSQTVTLGTLALGNGSGLASNYTLTGGTKTASFTTKSLSVTGIAASNKVYDGTTAATLTGTAVVSALSGDTVTVGGTGSGVFANKNVGTGKAVTVSGYTLGGADASNYAIVQPAGVTANITAKALSVSGTIASNKIYNGTTAATLTGGTLSGVISGDTVTLTQAGIFTSKNVGTGIAVTGADTLGGASASNYSVIQPTGLTANITARAINLTGSRIYDGTTTTAASIFTLGNLVSGETLTLSGSGSVASKNVSAGSQTVTLGTLALGNGSGLASNYTLTGGTKTASFTAKAMTISGITASNKTYDGTTAATISTAAVVYAGLVAGDLVTVSATGSFVNPNVGNGKTVNLSSSYTGADVSNYAITSQATTTANITP